MAAIESHPDAQSLQAFGAGLLDGNAALDLEAHVADCAICAAWLESAAAPADTLELLLRSADTLADAVSSSATDVRGMIPFAVTDVRAIPAALANHPRYRVLELLGAGGMGAVYKAEHRVMKRLVALKTINQALLEKAEAIERFAREARAAARLDHPHIVTAYDAEQAGGIHFLAMEFVEGETLAQHVAERGLPPIHLACAYIREAALGLAHAHERGMVHRDIKPHNLMLTTDGHVKILDFGLARFVQENQPVSRTEIGAVMGTPEYMAPEQALDTHRADVRADLYSLGCTLYFLLTGRPQLQGTTPTETLLLQQQTEPKPVGELRPDTPAGLAEVVARLLAKRPEDRYQTPADVADALTPLLSASSTTSTFPQLAKRSRPRRRDRRLWWAGLAAILLLGTAIGVNFHNQNSFPKQDPDAKPVSQGSTPTKTSDPTTEPVVDKTPTKTPEKFNFADLPKIPKDLPKIPKNLPKIPKDLPRIPTKKKEDEPQAAAKGPHGGWLVKLSSLSLDGPRDALVADVLIKNAEQQVTVYLLDKSGKKEAAVNVVKLNLEIRNLDTSVTRNFELQVVTQSASRFQSNKDEFLGAVRQFDVSLELVTSTKATAGKTRFESFGGTITKARAH